MADEVKVTFVADDAQLIASAKKIQAETDRLAGKLKEAGVSQSAYNKAMADAKAKFDQQTKATQVQKASFTELNSVVSLVQTGVRVLGQAYDVTIGQTMKYAQTVRDLAIASGAGAEEASTLLQVLDDFQISAEDVTAATKAMKEKGIVPTVESLAQLADTFVTIEDPAKRLEFAQDNLGKSYSKYLNILSQGGDALRENADAVNENLILTDEQIAKSEQLRLSQDQLNDTWQGLTTNIGTTAIPVLNDLLTATNNNIERGFQWSDVLDGIPIVNLIHRINDLKDAHEQNTTSTDETTRAADLAGAAYEDEAEQAKRLAEEAKAAAEATKAISEQNQLFLGVLDQSGSALTTYRDGLAEANAALAEGSITTDEHKAKVGELVAQYEEAKNQIVMSIVEMKLASDGWTNAELDAYLKIGEAQGVFTQDQINAAQGAITTADEMIAGYTGVAESAGAMSEAVGAAGGGLDAAGVGASTLNTNLNKAKTAALTAKDPIKHIGERAEDAGEGFGSMATEASELADAINSEALPAVAGIKSQILGLPKTGTQWNYTINIDVSGQVPGNLPGNGGGGGGNPNPPLNVGGGVIGAPCFVAGTLVTMADGSLVRIEDIREGDVIRSWHEGEFVSATVEKIFWHINAPELPATLVRLNGILTGTVEHLIYTNKQWIPLGFLQVGDTIQIDGKPAKVERIEIAPGFVPVYNLETNHESHNYYANGILVHNGKAVGGSLGAGWTLVGERGPELVSPSGYVYTYGQSMGIMSGGLRPGRRRATGGALRGENLLPPPKPPRDDNGNLINTRDEEPMPVTGSTQTIAAQTADMVSSDIQDAMQATASATTQQVNSTNQLVQLEQRQLKLLATIAANSDPARSAKATYMEGSRNS